MKYQTTPALLKLKRAEAISCRDQLVEYTRLRQREFEATETCTKFYNSVC